MFGSCFTTLLVCFASEFVGVLDILVNPTDERDMAFCHGFFSFLFFAFFRVPCLRARTLVKTVLVKLNEFNGFVVLLSCSPLSRSASFT